MPFRSFIEPENRIYSPNLFINSSFFLDGLNSIKFTPFGIIEIDFVLNE